MSKDQIQFQKAFVAQMKAELTGDREEASRARQIVNFYKRKLRSRH